MTTSSNRFIAAALAYPTYSVRDEMFTNFGHHAWRLVFPVLAAITCAP